MGKLFLVLGSILAALTVIIGAFGAHALASLLQENNRQGTFDTAVRYLMFHAVAILFVGLLVNQKSPHQLLTAAGISFTAGILLFSGSLFVLALTNHTKLGMIAPFGGLAFIGGWGILIYYLIRVY